VDGKGRGGEADEDEEKPMKYNIYTLI